MMTTTTLSPGRRRAALLAASATAALAGVAFLATSGGVSPTSSSSASSADEEIRSLRSSADSPRSSPSNSGGPSSLSSSSSPKPDHEVPQHKKKDIFAESEWCLPPKSKPLDYAAFCPPSKSNRGTIYKYGVFGGMTNALHYLLTGALHAAEDGTCFVVDQTGPGGYAPMAAREDPEEKTKNIPNFLGRYFEPIGLPWGGESSPEGVERHPIARDAASVRFVPYPQIDADERERKAETREKDGGKRTVESLGYIDMDDVTLKKNMLRRVWRLLPERRSAACGRLSRHGIKGEEYMAMSVRRGDNVKGPLLGPAGKSLVEQLLLKRGIGTSSPERKSSAATVPMERYVEAAESAARSHFGGVVPTIYVATDDCLAVEELRRLRPDWTFVSECDDHRREGTKGESGFMLGDMVHWSVEQTDAHYEKFFAELIGMAEAKYWIGVSTNHVSHWVYLMRGYDKKDDSWAFVDDDAKSSTVDYV